MNLQIEGKWEITAGLAAMATVAGLTMWLILRRRQTPDEVERARRQFLVQSGRLVDGMLLDIVEVEAEDGRTLTMLLYCYRVAGVDYECAQDVTALRDVLDPAQVRVGFHCSIRIQPGNPQNSIVVAENWTGLRLGYRPLPRMQEAPPLEAGHLHGSHG